MKRFTQRILFVLALALLPTATPAFTPKNPDPTGQTVAEIVPFDGNPAQQLLILTDAKTQAPLHRLIVDSKSFGDALKETDSIPSSSTPRATLWSSSIARQAGTSP